MKPTGTPPLDLRDARQIFEQLLARQPAYLPDWAATEGQPGVALLRILARYMEVIIERLNQAPDKQMLAFLDMLGISLIPAQAARAPVVFEPLPVPGNSRIPARIRLGATSNKADPLIFETDRAIAIATARLVEVKTVSPLRDSYSDHTVAFAGGRPFTLFEPQQPVPHILYLAHNTLLAFQGSTTVEIECELAVPGSDPLSIVWEYWDGQTWRMFHADASQDRTAGLTRSGVITLWAECGESQPTSINGIAEAHWMRGRLDAPLPPDPTRVLPAIDRIRLRSVIEPALFSWEVVIQPATEDDAPPLQGVLHRLNGKTIAGVEIELLRDNADPTSVPTTKSTTQTNAYGRYTFDADVFEDDPENTQYILHIMTEDLPPAEVRVPSNPDTIIIDFRIISAGTFPDKAFADTLPVDLNKTFYPFGYNPLPGATFYFSSQNILSKPGAVMSVWALTAAEPQQGSAFNQGLDTMSSVFVSSPPPPPEDDPPPEPEVVWEYWNGSRWVVLIPRSPGNSLQAASIGPFTRFQKTGGFAFIIPTDIAQMTVNNEKAYWMRARLKHGAYVKQRELPGANGEPISIDEPDPPIVEEMRLGYVYRSSWEAPEQCLTYNDFQFASHRDDARQPGGFFPPFRPVADSTPTMYLGFDQPLPNDLVSLYLDIQEHETAAPPLIWEAWDGTGWKNLAVTDETAGLCRPGMVSFIAPDVTPRPQAVISQAEGTTVSVRDRLAAAVFQSGERIVVRQPDATAGELALIRAISGNHMLLETPLQESYTGGTISLAALPRFGTSHDWVRVRQKQAGAPPRSTVEALYLNATWASQVQTVENEVLGSGLGRPNQTLFFSQVPVLRDEQIEVRELEGPRAAVELPILREALINQGMTEADLRVVSDPRTGEAREVWVRWQAREHFFFSGPDDRHYLVERSRGRLIFSDGHHGRLPPVGVNNIRARRYQAGGGLAGNVPAGAINQLLAAAPFVQRVSNPRAAEGGAEAETMDAVQMRGPQRIRHRGRALAARDYEALALEATPGVAIARALSATAPNLRPAAGWVTVIIVPQSQDPQPRPSFELRRQVHRYLAERTPATVSAARIGVIGPTYLPIGVAAIIVPRELGLAGLVESRARAALHAFLHPLYGGPDGRGWPFGRDVYLSDVAALLEAVAGVDYVAELHLLLNDTPQGEQVAVPPDRMVVAGTLTIDMQAA